MDARNVANSSSSASQDPQTPLSSKNEETTTTTTKTTKPSPSSSPPSPLKRAAVATSSSYVISQKIILLLLGIMYLLAFYGAFRQNEGLMGTYGLLPAKAGYVDRLKSHYGCDVDVANIVRGKDHDLGDVWKCFEGFRNHPSLFWFFEYNDANMRALHLAGITLSILLIAAAATPVNKRRVGDCSSSSPPSFSSDAPASMLLLFALWISYFTVVTSAGGTSFYQYGWESQLLETGFLSIFLCQNFWPQAPLRSSSSTTSAASPIVLWLFRWLSFRISIGAGMIKIRGDSCWTNKTCLLYHFETQPIPSPLSFAFHFLPRAVLQRAVDLDLFVQVYTSWFVLLPTAPSRFARAIVRVGGLIQTGFMVNIALSGNMSMLNHLTIIPAVACFDDACYPELFTGWYLLGRVDRNESIPSSLVASTTRKDGGDKDEREVTTDSSSSVDCPSSFGRNNVYKWRLTNPRLWVDVGLLVLIMTLSKPVVENLLQIGGKRQQMNASFDSFRLVNTYGAFGSVGKERYEPIVSIAYDRNGGRSSIDGGNESEWIELEFPCKPGALSRRPCFCAPYHYRVDWNIWFIGFKPHSHYLNQRETWLYNLLAKLLEEDEDDSSSDESESLLSSSPASSSTKPHQRGRSKKPWLDLLDPASAEMLRRRGPPTHAKVDMYRYQMAAPLWTILYEIITFKSGANGVRWWNRYFEQNLIPIVTLHQERKQLMRAGNFS